MKEMQTRSSTAITIATEASRLAKMGASMHKAREGSHGPSPRSTTRVQARSGSSKTSCSKYAKTSAVKTGKTFTLKLM